jgi:hypothetical protein
MKSHRHTRKLRRIVIGLAAIAALLPASATAAASPSTNEHSTAYSAALNSPTKVGDTPADFPGASRAPDVTSPTIEVVRPERTIVREADQVLPIVLSSAALLIALMGAAFVLVRMRVQRRHAVGGSH